MAKRAPVNEKPYNPVEEALVRTVWLGEKAPESGSSRHESRALLELEEMPGQATVVPEDNNGTNLVTLSNPQSTLKMSTQAFSRGKQAREKRVLLTHTEERQIELLVHRLALELSTPVKLSHILRACVGLLQHAEHEIVERAHQAAPLTRPPNGSYEALVEFEHRLAQLLLEALRKAPPLHS